MATNRDLLEQAESLGKQLGVTVQTQGLSSSALADLVTDLQKKAAAASEKTRASAPALPQADASPVRPPYAVAKGHSVISASRGILGEGAPVGEADVGVPLSAASTQRLERLVQLGRLVKG